MVFSMHCNADQAYPLYYAVQNRLQGKCSDYGDDDVSYLLPYMISPAGQVALAFHFSYIYHQAKTKKEADILLSELAQMDESQLQNFIFRMKANILKMQHVHAMAHHVFDDAFPLMISPVSALENDPKPAYIPDGVIDCEGIVDICDNSLLKEKFLHSVNQHISFSPHERARYLDDITMVRDITKDDCARDNLPNIMVGQRGVFARKPLPEHFFIGFYSGVYFDVLTDIVPFHDIMGVGTELYLFGVKGQDIPFISAYRFGNRISLINSATNYTGSANDIANILKYKNNSMPMRFKVNNNPQKKLQDNPASFDINGYVTTRPIAAGEQIFVDYGYNYWRNKNMHFTDASAEQIAQALSDI